METIDIALITLTVTLIYVMWLASKQGNDKRDVSTLGVLAGAFGLGSILALTL